MQKMTLGIAVAATKEVPDAALVAKHLPKMMSAKGTYIKGEGDGRRRVRGGARDYAPQLQMS